MAKSAEYDEFDYVLVGAGTAGCVLAYRLGKAGFSVCVLEAGPRDTNPYIHIPAGYIKNIYSKTLTWNFVSEPGPGVKNRAFALPQGRVLGGSSSINGLNHVRGQAADYDEWAQMGNPGWAYADVLAYFKRSETKYGNPDPKYRGLNGELAITDLDWEHPLNTALIDAAQAIGIPRNPDYNAADQEGVGYFQRTIRNGWRISAARAFLSKTRKFAHVSVRTSCHTSRILFQGKTAIGVEYFKGGQKGPRCQVRARREVILCAGALNTPKLLQLSGIGPKDILGKAGIAVRHHLPGVGNNLRDHYAVRMVSRIAGIRTINEMVRAPALLVQIARWLIGLPSPLAISPSLVHIFGKSDPSLTRADLEFACAPASFRQGVVGLLDDQPGLSIGVWQERPESLGFAHIQSANPFAPPAIQPNYLSHENDAKVLVRGMRLARKLFRTEPLRQYVAQETSPERGLETDAALLDFARENGTTVYHMIGTARMGPADRPGSVVDAQLRVHGLGNIRVVDASIMPSMPSANTNATTMMIAEKAADMVLGRRPATAD